MIVQIRKHQQKLMLIITVIIIIAFVWLYNGTQFDKLGQERAYRIYNRTVPQTEVERTARRFQVAQQIGMMELVYGLAGQAFSREQAIENFVWNSYVIDHEARAMGITASNEEVANGIRAIPAFQTNGQFDPIKYQEIIQNVLMPNGFTDSQLEDLVRDDLRLRRLTSLVGGTVAVTPAEFEALYTESNQKNHVALIRFPLETFAAEASVSEEEIAKYYETHAKTLTSEEARSAQFVKLELTEAEKALGERERVAALQKLANRSNEFLQALLADGATFEGVAGEFGVTPRKTATFTRSNAAPELAEIPQAANLIFSLNDETRFSDPVQSADGFYIFYLGDVVEKKPLTLEEARPRIVEAIRREKGQNAMVSKANAVRKDLAAALKKGESLQDAASKAGVTVQEVPAFALTEPPRDLPEIQQVAETLTDLADGGLSDFVQTLNGGMLIHLVRRDPVDKAKMAEEEKMQIESLRNFREISAFREWLQVRRKAANIHSLHASRATEDAG